MLESEERMPYVLSSTEQMIKAPQSLSSISDDADITSLATHLVNLEKVIAKQIADNKKNADDFTDAMEANRKQIEALNIKTSHLLSPL